MATKSKAPAKPGPGEQGQGKGSVTGKEKVTPGRADVKEIPITHWQDTKGQSKREECKTWPEHCEWFACLPPQTDKESSPLVKFSRFGNKRSRKNSLRWDENVLEVFGIEGDMDNGKLSFQEVKGKLEEYNIRAIILTSWSHTPEQPHLRVFCPLSAPCDPDQHRLLVGRLNGALDGNLARESFTLSQSYFVGGNPNAESLIDCTFGDPEDGYCLDELPELDEFSIFPPLQELKQKDVKTRPLPDDEKEIRIAAARKDKKLLKLFKGEAETGKGKDYPSRSEQDFAFASKIAFYLGPDPEAIEELMRKSKIVRDKWDKNDYLQRTILNVLARQQEFFEIKKKDAKPVFNTRKYNAAELLQMEFPEPKWAVPNLFAEGLNILGGKPKTGKSIMALNTGLSISLGGKALGTIDVEQGSVIYLALEDTGRRLKSRISNMLSRELGVCTPGKLDLFTEWPRMGEKGLELLEQEMIKYNDLRLVIIDTFALFRPRPKGSNSASYQEDYEHANAIKKLADKTGVAIVLIHHLRKMAADDVFDTFSGTLGFTGAADCLIAMTKGTTHSILHITGRDVEQAEYAVKLDPVTLSWQLVGKADEVKNTETQQTIFDTLKESDDPLSPNQVAEITGLKPGYIRKILSRLTKDGSVRKEGYGKYIYVQ